jgi:hypothetical protein
MALENDQQRRDIAVKAAIVKFTNHQVRLAPILPQLHVRWPLYVSLLGHSDPRNWPSSTPL